ncbi:hypothetical protein GUITHDRAFT_118964 [Guillardia theta CCMP2712]|uniref:Uncharacterized protein n=1 Tax=Guillardia theta (strain CCMP2712) TaxID=905079 RepID=L1IF04_GUITC|nr:hypothetical protein GUITHDRAFT_118964 [Guillardia theta CCMP2712]EKX34793.1 hypothetical protein GUITHDRAFT_118964 [Guillardia theta CCMP2712]|eukprot:XP_005821773.1 hypothetical protein GUITHDRAFT_118964 [Guillardia theta CCMP2712]
MAPGSSRNGKHTTAARRFLLGFILAIFSLQIFAIFLSIQISKALRNVHLPRLLPEDIGLLVASKAYTH